MTGVTVTAQPHIDPTTDVVLDDETTPSDVWSTIATTDAFRAALADGARELLDDLVVEHPGIGSRVEPFAAERRLVEAGVADEVVATVLTSLARPKRDRESWNPSHAGELDPHREALALVEQYGQQGESAIGVSLDLDDLGDGPLVLLDAIEPTIQFGIDASFRDLAATQRRAICSLVAALSQVADVRLVATPLVGRWLAEYHRAELPDSVNEQTKKDSPGRQAVEDAATAALDELSFDGRPVAILSLLANADSGTTTYDELVGEFTVGKNALKQDIKTLRDLDLVDSFRLTGTTFGYELTTVGARVVELIDEENRKQAALSEYLGESVNENPNVSDNNRVTPLAVGGGEGRPSGEEAAASTAPTRRRMDGFVSTGWVGADDRAGVFTAAPNGGLSLHDADIEAFDDRRSRALAYDPDEPDRLGVVIEYDNPLSHAVGIALALTSERALSSILTSERLDELDEDLRPVLRDMRNIPTPEEITGDALQEKLRRERDDLIDLLRRLYEKQSAAEQDTDDVRDLRSVVTRNAQGLWGSVAHLLDSIGVTPHYQVRIPEFDRNYSGESHATERRDLVRTIAHNVAIQSRYEQFAVFRQLFETREEKLKWSFSVDVDAADPVGEYIGSYSLVGPGVSSLADDLDDELSNPREIRESAPEFVVRVPVEDGSTREATARAVTDQCRRKNLRATREAVSVLSGLTGTSRDASYALHWLGRDSDPRGRDLDLVDVRYALAELSKRRPDRILPETSAGVRKIVGALLRADEPFATQKELAAAADVSEDTVATHRDRLKSLGLLREVAGAFVLGLPSGDDTLDVEAPAYVTDEFTTTTDVLLDVLVDLVPADDPIHAAEWYTDYSLLVDRLPWLRPWLDILSRLASDPSPEPIVPAFGRAPAQTSIAAVGGVGA